MKIETKSRIDHREVLLRLVREASRFNETTYRIRKYLESFDAKLHATFEAFDAMETEDRPDPAELASIASGLDPWKGTNEPVLEHRIPKDSPGQYRTVLEFGIQNRSLQYLVRDVPIVLLDLHPNQYATRGGVHAAIKHTKQALIDGYVWAVELDINDCYSSFDEEKLASLLLPLPKEVTEYVILSRHLNLSLGFSIVGNSPGDDQEGDAITPGAISPARRGIPQGSAASPIVAEAMVAIALKAVPTLGVIIAYADNTLLLAKTKSDRDSMTEALLAAFEAHPVGRLRLSSRTFAPGGPVEFLGHCLTPCEGGVGIEVSAANKRKFEDRMKSRLRSLAKTKRQRARREALHHIKQKIRSWADAFTLCDDTQKIRSYWLARLHWQFKEGPDSAFDEKETMNNSVYKTFKLHPDQKEIVEAALDNIKKHTGTQFDTVALELMAQSYMGSGISFSDAKSALVAEFKKSANEGEFLTKVAGYLEEITGTKITLTVEQEEATA